MTTDDVYTHMLKNNRFGDYDCDDHYRVTQSHKHKYKHQNGLVRIIGDYIYDFKVKQCQLDSLETDDISK